MDMNPVVWSAIVVIAIIVLLQVGQRIASSLKDKRIPEGACAVNGLRTANADDVVSWWPCVDHVFPYGDYHTVVDSRGGVRIARRDGKRFNVWFYRGLTSGLRLEADQDGVVYVDNTDIAIAKRWRDNAILVEVFGREAAA